MVSVTIQSISIKRIMPQAQNTITSALVSPRFPGSITPVPSAVGASIAEIIGDSTISSALVNPRFPGSIAPVPSAVNVSIAALIGDSAVTSALLPGEFPTGSTP
jgi:hypothetical protein